MVGVLTLLVVPALALYASASALAINGLLVARQTISPDNVPSSCLNTCNAILNTITACTTLACICTQSNAASLSTCVACVISNDPGTSVANTAETLLNTFYTDCAAAGFPVSISGVPTSTILPTSIPIATTAGSPTTTKTTTRVVATVATEASTSTEASTALPATGPLGHPNAGLTTRISVLGCLLSVILGTVQLLV